MKKGERVCPELFGDGGRSRLVVHLVKQREIPCARGSAWGEGGSLLLISAEGFHLGVHSSFFNREKQTKKF